MRKIKRFNRICLGCHDNRAIWADYIYTGGKGQLNYRPVLCDSCAKKSSYKWGIPLVYNYKNANKQESCFILNRLAHKLDVIEKRHFEKIDIHSMDYRSVRSFKRTYYSCLNHCKNIDQVEAFPIEKLFQEYGWVLPIIGLRNIPKNFMRRILNVSSNS